MALPQNYVAATTAVKTQYRDSRVGNVRYLPQRVALIGQPTTGATTDFTKTVIRSAQEAATKYGQGSQIHLAAKELFPLNGKGAQVPVTVYPVDDPSGGVRATGDIAISGTTQGTTKSYSLVCNGITGATFTITAGDDATAAAVAIYNAIQASLDFPMIVDGATPITGAVDFGGKWVGATGNDVNLEIVGETDGLTFAITQMASGAGEPDYQTALDQMGDVWETMVIACAQHTATAVESTLSTFNEGRWDPQVKKPFIAFFGATDTTIAALQVGVDNTSKTVSKVPAYGSKNLPFVVAAAAVTKIANLANLDPAFDYVGQRLTSLEAGSDADQFEYLERNDSVLAGVSTTTLRDRQVTLGNVVTYFAPNGDPLPAYRHVVDIVKMQQVIYNTNAIFESAKWEGAPLIPDGQATTNPNARKPKDAVAEVSAMIDNLALLAIISDPAAAKQTVTAVIDTQNPKRLNVDFNLQLSGNGHVFDIDFDFSYYFGQAPIV